ncbi:hypothetical protein B9Z55_020620 [Caenorhabditis nigoni]|nr:hypothetical protein B9Z55_020620 [Caenorhabditis nigoni]
MITEATTEVGAGCGMCDIDAIAPKTLQENVVFSTQPRDPVDGCQQIYTRCARQGSQICDPGTMTATNADGTNDVADDSTQTVVASTLICGDDGLYSHNGVTRITQLTCMFTCCI